MKAVRITKNTRDALKEYTDIKMSYDGIINRLINEVEDYMPLPNEIDNRFLNINLHEDTMDRIKSFSLTNGESYENIIIRMLLLSQTLNNIDD